MPRGVYQVSLHHFWFSTPDTLARTRQPTRQTSRQITLADRLVPLREPTLWWPPHRLRNSAVNLDRLYSRDLPLDDKSNSEGNDEILIKLWTESHRISSRSDRPVSPFGLGVSFGTSAVSKSTSYTPLKASAASVSILDFLGGIQKSYNIDSLLNGQADSLAA